MNCPLTQYRKVINPKSIFFGKVLKCLEEEPLGVRLEDPATQRPLWFNACEVENAKKLVIDLKTWARGDRDCSGTNLYSSSDGTKCCLGFYCLQAGTDIQIIKDYGDPQDAFGFKEKRTISEELGLLLVVFEDRTLHNSQFTRKAICINDAKGITDESRMEELQTHFKSAGIEVEFIEGT